MMDLQIIHKRQLVFQNPKTDANLQTHQMGLQEWVAVTQRIFLGFYLKKSFNGSHVRHYPTMYIVYA